MRRLPIFLLIDVSESMAGDNLRQLQEGLERLVRSLRADPYALETVFISVIAFAGKAKVDQAASLVHMMNQNTFTAAAYHCTDDADALATALRDNIQQRQWMCGFPDKVAVAVVGEYVVSVFGAEDLVNTFMSHLNGIFGVQPVYDEAIL